MPSLLVRTLKLSISSLLLGSVMTEAFAATGTPALLPKRACFSGRILISMNLYARSLFVAFSGTTHVLPAEPVDILAPGNRNVPHLKVLTSVGNRLDRQLPE